MLCLPQNRRSVKQKAPKLHEGKWLRDQIAATEKSLAEFSRRTQIPLPTIKNWLKQAVLKIRPDHVHRLAAGLKHSKISFDMALDRARVYAMLQDAETRERWASQSAAARSIRPGNVQDMLDAGLPIGESGTFPPPLDRNVDPYSEQKIPTEIPLFDLSVACGSWADVGESMEVCDPRAIEQGLFRVRLSGDSMSPKWKNGDIAEFKCLRWAEDVLEVGKDYYVQRDDGTATFKTLVAADENGITLQAINKRKYPDRMAVPMIGIVRMANALAKIQLVE
jgi:hypothetical protein